MFKKLVKAITGFNEKVAVFGTKWFSSIWTFYVFFLLGLMAILPILPDAYKTVILLTSSAWLQLFALPLLAVGNNVLNKAAEKRAKQDHETIQKELQEIKEIHKLLHEDALANSDIMNKLDHLLEDRKDIHESM